MYGFSTRSFPSDFPRREKQEKRTWLDSRIITAQDQESRSAQRASWAWMKSLGVGCPGDGRHLSAGEPAAERPFCPWSSSFGALLSLTSLEYSSPSRKQRKNSRKMSSHSVL